METRSVFGHVGSVCIVDALTSDGSEPGMTLQHLTKVIESRLPLVPLFRRRLVMVPFGLDHPYWIEDPDFDIEFHVRELALPFPGNDRQLSEQVARLHARPLDRSRPLWELYLITGLHGGRAPIDQLLGGKDDDDLLSQNGLRAPSTPFNAPISPHRRWAFADLPLGEVKTLRRGFDGAGLTVNDVVLALCAGALRRWLQLHEALPAAPLIAAVPVSVRTKHQKGGGGNKVSMMLAALPTNLTDPGDRLAAVHEAMRAAKDQHGAIPAGLLADVSQFAMPAPAK